MQTVKLNLIPGSVLPVVNVSQYDKTRQFALQIYEGATAYSLTGKDVQIRGTKPDGNGFAYDATDGVVSVSGNTVTISTTQQMTAVGGQTIAELRITSGDTILGTLNFVLMVEPSALSDDTPISETEIPVIERDFEEALEEAQEAAETATTKAGEAATSATSAATSETNAGNSATTASSAATTATTKAGEASTSATTASTAATAAAADSLEAEGWAVGEQGGQPVGPASPYYQNNAAYYAAQAGQYATGGLIFKGSVAFANIPTTGMVNGDMYNITDDFTTDSRFIEGAGVSVKAGADIAFVAGSVNKWDILALGGGGGADALDDLTDVNFTSPAEGDLLQYDHASGKWENSDAVPQELAAMQEAGAVNQYNNALISQVVNGVTVTVYADKTITLNGTATARIDLSHTISLSKGSHKLNGAPASGFAYATEGYFGIKKTGVVDVNTSSTGREAHFTLSEDTTNITAVLTIRSGASFNNLVIKPMIYDARLVNPPYQPFTMTNRELTDAIDAVDDWEDITSQCTFPQESRAPHETDATMVLVNKSQKLISICARFNTSTVTDFGNQLTFLYLPTGYRFNIPGNGYSNSHFVVQGLAQVRISDAVYTGDMDTHRQLWWRYQNSSDNGVGQMVLSYPTAGTAKAGYLVIPLLVAPIQ